MTLTINTYKPSEFYTLNADQSGSTCKDIGLGEVVEVVMNPGHSIKIPFSFTGIFYPKETNCFRNHCECLICCYAYSCFCCCCCSHQRTSKYTLPSCCVRDNSKKWRRAIPIMVGENIPDARKEDYASYINENGLQNMCTINEEDNTKIKKISIRINLKKAQSVNHYSRLLFVKAQEQLMQENLEYRFPKVLVKEIIDYVFVIPNASFESTTSIFADTDIMVPCGKKSGREDRRDFIDGSDSIPMEMEMI